MREREKERERERRKATAEQILKPRAFLVTTSR
jgi:hypothetical protein